MAFIIFYLNSVTLIKAQVGTLTGTGMSICNLYSFSICPTQTITPLNYGNQGYACTGTNMPDVSFNILGGWWRVMINNWKFSTNTSGIVSGYNSTGVFQSFPFTASNTITPLSYSGTFVQFAVNGVATGSFVNQATFSISLNPVVFGTNSYTYCPNTSTSVSISPVAPTTGGPWTYNWQPGNMSGSPAAVSPSVNTIYTVTATSTAGCSSNTTVSVNLNCQSPPLCSGNLGVPVFFEDFGSGTALYGPALPAGVTNYIYQTGTPPNGTYVISNSSNPSGVNLGYVADGDHTGNLNGYMMVINSDYPASEVYRKHVTGLCQNTTYVFSSYLSNNNTPSTPSTVCPGYVYANVKFLIEYPLGTVQNSVATGNLPLGLSNTALNWNEYGFAFTTLPGQTSVDIVLKNNALGGCGNDYVVDDISLSPCGPGVSLNIFPNQTVFCIGDSINLQSNFTSGSYVNPQYQWQNSSDSGITWINIVGATSQNYSIPSVSALQGGIYQLIVAENGNINSSSCSIIAGPIAFSIDSTCNTNLTLFSAPDTVCVNQQFNVINQSVGATSYYWNFCQGNTSTIPQGINLGNVGFFNGPVFISVAKDGTDYYAFVTNNSASTITRLFFGSSLMNAPIATNLGNVSGVLPGNLEDIHLELENGNWYGIVTGGMSGGERIVRLNFGATLANVPTATNFGNIGGLNYPQRIKVFQSNGNYYGFIANRNNNTITRISFGSSLANIPTGTNLGNIGALNIPDALGLIYINNLWYGYVINEGNSTISRLDFGASLLNIPTGTNLGNTGALNGPRAIDMWTECGQIKGLITNRYSNDILDMNFSTGPTGPVNTVSYGNIAGFSFPHSISRFRSGDTLYAFVTNVSNNSLSRVYFPNCTNSSIASSNLSSPPAISYNNPGIYYISQVTNEGQLTQGSYCKQITVLASPTVAVLSPSVCSGQTTTLTATGASTYTWSTGVISNSIIVSPTITTSYSVIGSSGSCTNQAISTVSVIPNSTISITGNTVICAGQSTILTANGSGGFIWNTSATTTSISVSPVNTSTYNVSSPGGMCSVIGTITVSVIPSPTISVSGNIGICSTQTTVLTASGANNYVWSTSASSSSIIVNPNVTTSYSVVGIVGTCTNQAVVTVTVNSIPIILSLNNTNSGCGLSNGSSTVSVLPSSCTYTWGNGSTSNISSNLPPGNQTLSISNSGCITQTFVTIDSQPGPLFISASVNNTSCGLSNGSVTVTSTPSNNTYSWSSGVSSTTNTAGSLSAGIYTIHAINGACQTDTVVSILISFPLQIMTSTIVASDCNVNNGSIAITDNGVNPTYSWSPGISSNSNSFINLATGTYSLTISDGACVTSSVFVVPLINGPTGLNVIQKNAICQSKNGSINVVAVLNGLPPYQYSFNNTGFSSLSSFGNLNQGNYSLSVKDSNNCIFTQTFTIGISQTTVTVNETIKSTSCDSNDGEIRINNINGGTAPYLISFNNTSYRPDTVFGPLSAGSYSMNILDSNKCITGFTIIVPENGDDYTLYIPNTFTPNTDIVNDIWYVQGTCLGEFNCMIYNRWGEKIIELKDIKEGWNGKYKEKEVPEGIYVYVISVKTKKGVVKKSGHITVFR